MADDGGAEASEGSRVEAGEGGEERRRWKESKRREEERRGDLFKMHLTGQGWASVLWFFCIPNEPKSIVTASVHHHISTALLQYNLFTQCTVLFDFFSFSCRAVFWFKPSSALTSVLSWWVCYHEECVIVTSVLSWRVCYRDECVMRGALYRMLLL